MARVHSHYENLKVARDATPEAIRSAYRMLTRKHHPDRNPDNPDAERVMSVINVAYQALSDPTVRREHDRWIAQAEKAPGGVAEPAASPRAPPFTLHEPASRRDARHVAEAAKAASRRGALPASLRTRVAWAAAVVALALLVEAGFGPMPSWHRPQAELQAIEGASPSAYRAPPAAPNGQPWPERSGYVDGYSVKNVGGLSEVTVDNAGNDADMFVKLFSLDGPQGYAVRTFMVRAHGSFKLTGLLTGSYDLRYRNLADGRLSRSQFFTLEEVKTSNGVRFDRQTVALHRVAEAGVQAFELAESEF